jgi:hypothetical protein
MDRVTRNNWRDTVADIERMTAPTTKRQHQIAEVAGIVLPKDMPQLVAAARLQTALGADMGSTDESAVDEVQDDILAALEAPTLRITTPPENHAEAEAWIAYLRLKRRQQALERLELMAGDIVEVDGSEQIAEASSIGSQGRIYFKGSGSGGAWPDKLTVRCRKDANTAEARALMKQASNSVASNARADYISGAKLHQLRRYEVESALTLDVVEEMQSVIAAAKDERPIQEFIENHPETLAALLGGQDRFVLPQLALAGKYVPDFLVCDTDSLGFRWLLVELETPQSAITLASKNELDASARRGVAQVKEWREWLQNNIDVARSPVKQDGLGLVDIRPRSEGLVLVGRRGLLNDNAGAMRHAYREESQIRIQTYDWLVERLFGILSYSEPPRTSLDVIRPQHERTRSHSDATP